MSDLIVFGKEEPQYGKAPSERSIEELLQCGIVVIDKHPGPTSREVDTWIRKILNVEKVGHSGTLDPRVTGVLPICINDAVKIMPALRTMKEYVGVMRVHKPIEIEKVRALAKKFHGKIKQMPPVKSAVKREEREREIFEFEILEQNGNDFLFRVLCEAGTYIRKLCSDMGRSLGGAHMQELRRTRAVPFDEKKMLILQKFEDAFLAWKINKDETELRKYLMPIEFGVSHLGRIVVRNSAVDAICNGAPVFGSGVLAISKNIEKGNLVAIETVRGELVGIANALHDSDFIKEKMQHGLRTSIAKTDRIVMKRGIYPQWKKQ